MKKGVILLLIALLAFDLVSAYGINVTNSSINTNYALGQLISGQFSLNLTNVPVNLYFSSELGTMNLRDFLKANGQPLSCEGLNCSDVISLANNGETSKSISLNNNEEKNYALSVTDSGVSLSKLIINVTSNFPESSSLPLSFKVGNTFADNYSVLSESYNRQTSYGCFNPSLSSYDETTQIGQQVYCEKMNLSSSNKYIVGAQISGSGLKELEFQLFDKLGVQLLGKCRITKDGNTVTSFSDTSSCKIETTSLNPESTYFVCVKDAGSDSTPLYKIRSETTEANCGSYNKKSDVNSTIDYAIYAKLPTYSPAPSYHLFNFNSSNGGLSAMNSYISQNYNSNCANTCVIPISVLGVQQDLKINSIELTYGSSTGQRSTNKIYEASYNTRTVNFVGSNLLLEKFNWSLNSFGNKSFNLNLLGDGTKKILNATLRTLSLPVVDSITPLNPPAGIPVFFFTKVRNVGNSSRYEWNFGDGSPLVVTNVSYTRHVYSNISSYNVTIRFGEGSYLASNNFAITTINPKEKLNQTMVDKRVKLNHANTDVLSLPSWYQSTVLKTLDLDYYQSELNRLEAAKVVAYTDQEFLEIANSLYNLAVPWAVTISERKTGPLLGEYTSFDPAIVQEIFPGSVEPDLSLYKPSIFNWQIKNIQSAVTESKLKMIDENDQFKDIISVYEVEVTSLSSDESYFIIQKDFSEVNFNSASSSPSKKVGSNTYVVVPSEGKVSFSFFLNGSQAPIMFVSPKLSLLSTSQIVDVCNFNARCEKGLGENSKNCNTDCASVGWTWFWLILFLIAAVIVYTFLQIWYKRKYEQYLFKDRVEMHNLLAFIDNARMNKLSNQQIRDILTQKGWEKDQVEYALLRSEGKNPGMFEIIPVDKIASIIEKRRASALADKKIVAPVNPYPLKQGSPKPAFNPLGQQRQPSQPPQGNKTTTRFGQQSNTKY